MPLDEREKRELARRVIEQRKAAWKAETDSARHPNKGWGREKTERVSGRQPERKEIGQSLKYQSDKLKVKKNSRDARSSIPALKLALLVMIGLIAAIITGITIGYLAATYNLIDI